MSLFLTKSLLDTPASVKSVAKCRPVNSKLLCPTEKRLGFSTKCQLSCRWSWRRTKRLFDCPSSSESIVDGVKGNAEHGRPFMNCHLFAVIFQLFSLSWWEQKFIFVPVCIDSISKRGRRNPSFFSPLTKALIVAADINSFCPPSVLCLLIASLPSAVFGFVVAIVIDPAYGCFSKWLRPHIAQERRERVLPSGADGDASSTIVHIAWLVLVVASFNHATPSSIFCTSRKPMSCVAKNGFLSSSTSTRQSVFQVIRRNVPSGATRAFAQPCRFSAVVSNPSVLQYGPLTVLVPSQIFNLVWNSNRITCSHDASLVSRVVRATQRVMTVGLLAFYRIRLAEPSGKWR